MTIAEFAMMRMVTMHFPSPIRGWLGPKDSFGGGVAKTLRLLYRDATYSFTESAVRSAVSVLFS